jgi:hypothetical protein
MDYFCTTGSYFWMRSSQNPPKAKFAELIFQDVHE